MHYYFGSGTINLIFMKKTHIIVLGVIVVLAIVLIAVRQQGSSSATGDRTLKVAIAPYQDMALLMNKERENIEKKHDLKVEYTTLAWEDLTPTIASAGATVDIAFANITEFVTNERNINKNTEDPLVFIYPAYVFLGGSIVSLNPKMPVITQADLTNQAKLKEFLKFKFAAPEKSQFEQMLYVVAQKAGVDFKTVNVTHIGMAEGLLATINGSIDASGAGLTQRNEAIEKGGKVVLDSADVNSFTIAGFVTKKSTLEAKRAEIEDFMKIWTDSIDYVFTDIDNRAAEPIAYLDAQSSTNYTVESFKNALAQEVFARNIGEVKTLMLDPGSKWDFVALQKSLTEFELANGIITEAPQNIEIMEIKP
jgi:ABC-type nitrate/sulfonate/bicarbonate transport system substrate-binding protein